MKIGLVSLGCPKNLVDSEVMLGLAQEAGHEITNDADDADVIVVNTCAFIGRAKEESIDTILEMAQKKDGHPGRRLIVTGCLAERYREELQGEIPEIDAVLGTGEVPAILDALSAPGAAVAAGAAGLPPASAAPMTLFTRSAEGHTTPATLKGIASRHRAAAAERELPTYIYTADTPRRLTTPGHYAYVKVAEGCDYNCSFCIIPALRGQYRSRAHDDIVREARSLAARGVKELILISQDTTFYGIDRKERGALARLLRALNAVEGLEWIRLLYLYPTTITDDVLEAMAECEKVCKYIDLPLQHAAESMLRRMRRPGNRASYTKLLDRVRTRLPQVTLRTTFVIGFPGETKAEFDDLLGFVRDVGFDHVGAFTYSHEEGTAAYALADDVAARTKTARQRRLMELQRGIVEARHAGRIGQRVRVMVDGPSDEHDLVIRGRLEGHAPEIDPVVYFTDCDPGTLVPGTLVEADVLDARDYDLVARPL